MIFLNSSVLYFLPLLVVPIIVHLLNLHRAKKLYFSKVDVISKIEESTSSLLKMKNWLLLLSRLLFLLFLILGFAQPHFPNKEISNNGKGILIYIDNSPSMFVKENGYEPISEAINLSLKLIEGVNDAQGLFVITNDFTYLDKENLSKKQAKEYLSNIKVCNKPRTVKSILSRINMIDNQNELSKVFYLSDLQNAENDAFQDAKNEFYIFPFDQGNYSNVVVDSVWFDSPAMLAGRNAKLQIKLRGFNVKAENSTTVKVEVNNQLISSQQVVWSESEANKLLTLSFDLAKPGIYEGKVSLDDVPVNYDNHFHFIYQVLDELNISILSNKKNNPISEVYETESLFTINTFEDGELRVSDLIETDFLIVEGFDLVSNNEAVIKSFLEKGNHVLLVPKSKQDDIDAIRPFFDVIKTDSIKKRLEVNDVHPYFKGVLLNSIENINVPWYIPSFKVRNSMSYVFENRAKNNGIGYINYEEGKIGLIPFPLNSNHTNFHEHSYFLPFMFEAAFNSSNQKESLFYRTGDRTVNLPIKQSNQVVELNKTGVVYLAQEKNGSYLIGDKLEAGVYNFNNSGAPILALNYEQSESIINFLNSDEIVAPDNVKVIKITDEVKLQEFYKSLSLGFSLWKYCLILSMLFIITEIAIIRFFR